MINAIAARATSKPRCVAWPRPRPPSVARRTSPKPAPANRQHSSNVSPDAIAASRTRSSAMAVHPTGAREPPQREDGERAVGDGGGVLAAAARLVRLVEAEDRDRVEHRDADAGR